MSTPDTRYFTGSESLRESLDNSQSLLVMIGHLGDGGSAMGFKYPSGITPSEWDNEGLTKLIEDQIAVNRATLDTKPQPVSVAQGSRPWGDAATCVCEIVGRTTCTHRPAQPTQGGDKGANTYPWTVDGYWEYVSGLAGDLEADQMRDMLAQKGLQIVGISDPAYTVQSRDDTLRGLAEFFNESVHHVWDNHEIADCLTGMIGQGASPDHLQAIHDEVNALGGRSDQDNSYDQGIVDTVAKVLGIIERAQATGELK